MIYLSEHCREHWAMGQSEFARLLIAIAHSSSLTAALVIDRLIRKLMYLPIERQVSCRMQLRHENYDHLLFRVNREKSVEESSPAEWQHQPFRTWRRVPDSTGR